MLNQEEIMFIAIAGIITIIILSITILIFFMTYQKRKLGHKHEKEQLQLNFSQTLLQTQLEIQEQTLKNISEEIHDNIGQALSLAKLNLNTLPEIADEATQQKIVNSKELVSKAIIDLRNMSKSLDTDYVRDMGLQPAIEYELDMIKKTGGHKIELSVNGSLFRFDKQKELILFRIVQEILNNIIKHAKAEKIAVHIIYDLDKLQLTISDDGQGVNLTPLNENDRSGFGLGIRNMHNRAKLIGADFNMSSSIGKGSEVKIILPKEKNTNVTT